MNKPPDETLKQGRNRSWLLVKYPSVEQNHRRCVAESVRRRLVEESITK